MCIARTEGLTLLLIVDGRFDFQYSDGNPANICAEFPCNFHFFLEEHKLELKYSCNFLARSKSSYAIGDSKGWEVALILTASAAPRKRPGGNIDRLIGLVPQLWGDKGTKNSERDTRWSPFHGWVLNQRSNKSFGLGSFGKIPSPNIRYLLATLVSYWICLPWKGSLNLKPSGFGLTLIHVLKFEYRIRNLPERPAPSILSPSTYMETLQHFR
jgi:hypothetical protein